MTARKFGDASAFEARLGDVSEFITKGATPTTYGYRWQNSGVPFLRSECVSANGLDLREAMFISHEADSALKRSRVRDGDILMTITGNVGRVVQLRGLGTANINQHIARIRVRDRRLDSEFVYYYLSQPEVRKFYESITTGQAYPQISLAQVRETRIVAPPLDMQRRIAKALRHADALTERLDRLMVKQREIKRGAAQLLLAGKTRLPGFTSPWTEKTLDEVSINLDSLREPVSEVHRREMQGPFPYCGANGVLDHVNDYRIDDDVILLAEDGGNFDQFATRPIAYRMRGKIWVNNHAHVLKAASGTDNGFLFYALEHKDITACISSGTRSKLTRYELNRIGVSLPKSLAEQEAISRCLAEIDALIASLRRYREKAVAIKRGMMQELLTGRTRLVPQEVSA